MPDWSASECTDYKDDAFATVARASLQESTQPLSDTWERRGPCCLVGVHQQLRRCLCTLAHGKRAQRLTHVKPKDQSSRNPIDNAKSAGCLRSRKVASPWTGETHFRVAPIPQSRSVFRTSARILAPLSDMNPMAIADSGASHEILPITALHDDKSAKQVNLRLAAGEIAAMEAHQEIFAEHVAIPLCLRRAQNIATDTLRARPTWSRPKTPCSFFKKGSTFEILAWFLVRCFCRGLQSCAV